jgi:phage terminase large subunit
LINIPKAFKGLFTPKRYKILWGGRGSGKSTSVALALLVLGAQKKTRILCAREIQNSIADSVHKLLKDLISSNPEFASYEVLQSLIRHPNGSEFIFKGLRLNVNDIKSTEGVNICWVEEAQSVSAESWDILVPTIRDADSEIWISFNPHFEDDPTYQRFVKNADGDNSILIKANYDSNPFLTEVLKDEMERDKKRDYQSYLHIWEGEFKKTTDTAIFKNWKIENFEAHTDAEYLFGADWGFANDPTTLIKLYIKVRTLYICAEAYGYQTEIVDIPELFGTV